MLNGDHDPASPVWSEAGPWAQAENRQLPTSSLIQNPILGQKPRSSGFGAMLGKGGVTGLVAEAESPKQPQAFP